MEHIRHAVELAKERANSTADADTSRHPDANAIRQAPGSRANSANFVALNTRHLEDNRIVAHDIVDPRSRSYDVLRTEILHAMESASWTLLAVTSPTPACGKTLTATNLALSIARRPEKPVLLIDFDLQRPQVAKYLGLKSRPGALALLEGRISLADAITNVRVADSQMLVLPCENATLRSSQLLSSQTVGTLLKEIRRDFAGYTVVIDLPPILAGDDVLSILPHVDCAVFVVAAGETRVKEVKRCNKHLKSTPVVRVVLNKAEESSTHYYSRYSEM